MPQVAAQVVIRERVPVAATPGAQRAATGDVIRGDDWPGGVRGRGTVRVSGVFSLLGLTPDGGTIRVATSSGAVYSASLADLAGFSSNRFQCSTTFPRDGPPGDGLRRYFETSAPAIVLPLASDEDLAWAELTGTGVAERRGIRVYAEGDHRHNFFAEYVPFSGCTWSYSRNGDAGRACDCVAASGTLDGELRLSWDFEPTPADGLHVGAADTLDVDTGGGSWTAVSVRARYADGVDAPYDDAQPVVVHATPTPYGSLQRWAAGAGQERGTTLAMPYRSASTQIRFVADGDPGDGSAPAAEGPRCDTPVTISASGDGLAGETTVVLRGWSTATAPTDLLVSADPDSLGPGDAATLRATLLTADGCAPPDVDPDAPVTFSVGAPDADGRAESGLVVGAEPPAATVTVSYADAQAGAVAYLAAPDAITCAGTVRVTAEAEGLAGAAELRVGGAAVGAPDSLLVRVTPSTLAPGDTAAVSAVAVGGDDRCPDAEVDPDEPMRVVLSGEGHGDLAYDGRRGAALTVPYGDLAAGAVRFIAADSTRGVCGTVWVGVFGAGASGEAAVEVVAQSDGGDPATGDDGRPAQLVLDDGRDPPEGCGPFVCPTAPPDWEVVERALALAEALADDPYGLLDVPCDQIPAWAEVGSHVVPQAVLDEFDQDSGDPFVIFDMGRCLELPPKNEWYVQRLTSAVGSLLNMDYYPVDIRLPQGMRAQEFFELVRADFGSLFDPEEAIFNLYDPIHEARWENGTVLGTVGQFTIRLEFLPPGMGPGRSDELGVLGSDYVLGPEVWYWRFSTVRTPAAGAHPVSGTREFGVTDNGDGTVTFYTRGVDRLTDALQQTLSHLGRVDGVPRQFVAADRLWRGLQARVAERARSLGADATVIDPDSYQVDWAAYRSYFEGAIGLETLLSRIACY